MLFSKWWINISSGAKCFTLFFTLSQPSVELDYPIISLPHISLHFLSYFSIIILLDGLPHLDFFARFITNPASSSIPSHHIFASCHRSRLRVFSSADAVLNKLVSSFSQMIQIPQVLIFPLGTPVVLINLSKNSYFFISKLRVSLFHFPLALF